MAVTVPPPPSGGDSLRGNANRVRSGPDSGRNLTSFSADVARQPGREERLGDVGGAVGAASDELVALECLERALDGGRRGQAVAAAVGLGARVAGLLGQRDEH